MGKILVGVNFGDLLPYSTENFESVNRSSVVSLYLYMLARKTMANCEP